LNIFKDTTGCIVQQLLSSYYYILFDDLPAVREKVGADIIQTYYLHYSLFSQRTVWQKYFRTLNGDLMKLVTHLHEWQFFLLAEKAKWFDYSS